MRQNFSTKNWQNFGDTPSLVKQMGSANFDLFFSSLAIHVQAQFKHQTKVHIWLEVETMTRQVPSE